MCEQDPHLETNLQSSSLFLGLHSHVPNLLCHQCDKMYKLVFNKQLKHTCKYLAVLFHNFCDHLKQKFVRHAHARKFSQNLQELVCLPCSRGQATTTPCFYCDITSYTFNSELSLAQSLLLAKCSAFKLSIQRLHHESTKRLNRFSLASVLTLKRTCKPQAKLLTNCFESSKWVINKKVWNMFWQISTSVWFHPAHVSHKVLHQAQSILLKYLLKLLHFLFPLLPPQPVIQAPRVLGYKNGWFPPEKCRAEVWRCSLHQHLLYRFSVIKSFEYKSVNQNSHWWARHILSHGEHNLLQYYSLIKMGMPEYCRIYKTALKFVCCTVQLESFTLCPLT